MSIATIVTRGYGSFGSISKIVTAGFDIAAAVVTITPAERIATFDAENRKATFDIENRIATFDAENRKVIL